MVSMNVILDSIAVVSKDNLQQTTFIFRRSMFDDEDPEQVKELVCSVKDVRIKFELKGIGISFEGQLKGVTVKPKKDTLPDIVMSVVSYFLSRYKDAKCETETLKELLLNVGKDIGQLSLEDIQPGLFDEIEIDSDLDNETDSDVEDENNVDTEKDNVQESKKVKKNKAKDLRMVQ